MANGPPGPQIVVPGAGWVDMLSRVVVQVGFPVVVAAVLLWFLLTKFQDNMNAITTRMGNNTTVVTALIEQERNSFQELQRQSTDLSQQTILMKQLVDDGGRLLELHNAELETLKRMENKQKENR